MSDRATAELAEPVVVFIRSERVFAIRASVVRYLLPTPRVSGFPTSYEPMLGVFAHMGRVYPLLDPSTPSAEVRRSSPVAVVAATELGEVGFVADTVLGLAEASEHASERLDVTEHARRAREAMRRAPRAP